jgi:5-formyltetrahydrofolate cyclo-ligase
METKMQFRQSMRFRRDRLTGTARLQKTRAIEKRLARDPWYLEARLIFFYVSFNSEVETRPLIQMALDAGKMVCIPRVLKSRRMELRQITSLDQLKFTHWKIDEPIVRLTQKRRPDELDLAVVPGLAFDGNGNRIGYGKGYFDRWLKTIPLVRSIGLAFDFQIARSVPADQNDVPVRKIITPTRTICRQPD